MMTTAISKYKLMWIYVIYDLPTKSEYARKQANLFRRSVLAMGFTMQQWSIYSTHASDYAAAQHIKQAIVTIIDELLSPLERLHVEIISMTDKQHGDRIVRYHSGGKKKQPYPRLIGSTRFAVL
jgi:CRISPR-associated protein Cas2